MVNAAYSRPRGERHQVRVLAGLCLHGIWEVVPAVWPTHETFQNNRAETNKKGQLT